MSQTINLIDARQNVVAVATVDDKGSYFSGTVSVDRMPEPMLKTFEQYESLINDQVLSLLDEIEQCIDGMLLTAVFGDGHAIFAADLQIFPKAGTISFKVAPQRVSSPKV